MRTVSVRELQRHASALLRVVDETGEIVEGTRHGQVVARLVPARRPVVDRDANGAWTDLQSLVPRISAAWPEGVSAAEAVAEGRRAL